MKGHLAWTIKVPFLPPWKLKKLLLLPLNGSYSFTLCSAKVYSLPLYSELSDLWFPFLSLFVQAFSFLSPPVLHFLKLGGPTWPWPLVCLPPILLSFWLSSRFQCSFRFPSSIFGICSKGQWSAFPLFALLVFYYLFLISCFPVLLPAAILSFSGHPLLLGSSSVKSPVGGWLYFHPAFVNTWTAALRLTQCRETGF